MYRKNREFDLKHFLDNLEFIDVKGLTLRGRYPKISYEIERSILKKVFNCELKIADIKKSNGEPVFYRTTGGRYFKIITTYPTGSTKEKSIRFDKGNAAIIGAVLSSNLYFWFYQIYSNNLDLKSYEIEIFGLPKKLFEMDNKQKLIDLYEQYLKDIELNVNVRQTSQYANINSFKEYKIGKSKHLINSIDDFLGPLYGLGKEEVEFLKNYELPFRISD